MKEREESTREIEKVREGEKTERVKQMKREAEERKAA